MPIEVIARPADAYTRKNKISGLSGTYFLKSGPPASLIASQKPIRVNIYCIPIDKVNTSEAAFFSLSKGPRGLGLQIYGPLRIQAFDI